MAACAPACVSPMCVLLITRAHPPGETLYLAIPPGDGGYPQGYYSSRLCQTLGERLNLLALVCL